MESTTPVPRRKVEFVPDATGGPPDGEPGTLFVRGAKGGMRVAPDAGFDVVFGRCEPDVHVCVGPDDPHVSRRHGYITREHAHWMLYNLGRLPIRFPGARLVLSGHAAKLPVAHTPLFIVGPEQEHLLEVRIAAATPGRSREHPQEADTRNPPGWKLSANERLVLVCLGQRYLRPDPWPQPLAWTQVEAELDRIRPGQGWTAKRAAHIVSQIRKRLSAKVAGLMEEEIPPPLGNTLNHNLITELLATATIGPADLRLLDEG
jgi:hypothetical protein